MGLLDIIPPGMGASQAMRNHLSARRVRYPDRPDLHYSSPAELLQREAQVVNGRPLPSQYEHHRGPMNRCFMNALEAALADPSLRYTEGWYMVYGEPCNHAWCTAPDGGVVEVTYPTTYSPNDYVRFTEDGTDMPWVEPERWAYAGLEFEASFIQAQARDFTLPLLDCFGESQPDVPGMASVPPIPTEGPLRAPYDFRGWPV